MTPSLTALLRTLAAARVGVHSSHPALAAWPLASIGAAAHRLAARGELFFARIGTREARFFATADDRTDFVAAHTARVRPRALGISWRCAQWEPDAEPVTPPDLVIQYGPCHPLRFSEHRFAFIHG